MPQCGRRPCSGEHEEPILGLTGARVVVWQLRDSDEAARQWGSVMAVIELGGRGK
jgi:hypothetical protein